MCNWWFDVEIFLLILNVSDWKGLVICTVRYYNLIKCYVSFEKSVVINSIHYYFLNQQLSNLNRIHIYCVMGNQISLFMWSSVKTKGAAREHCVVTAACREVWHWSVCHVEHAVDSVNSVILCTHFFVNCSLELRQKGLYSQQHPKSMICWSVLIEHFLLNVVEIQSSSIGKHFLKCLANLIELDKHR